MGKKRKLRYTYEALEKIAGLWRIMGIFPFTLQYPIGVKEYGLSKLYAAYTLSKCLGSVWVIAYQFFNNNYIVSSPFSVTRITTLIQVLGSILCMLTCEVLRIIRHKDFTESIKSMIAEDKIIEKIGCPLDYARSAKVMRIYVWSHFVFISSFVAVDLYQIFKWTGSLGSEWYYWVMPMFVQIMDLTLFASLVGLLGVKLRAVNQKIKAIAVRSSSSPPQVLMARDVYAENLQVIARVHYNICVMGKRINRIFSYELIINVIVDFVVLSMTLYTIFIEFHTEGPTNYGVVAICMQWEFIHGIPMILVVVACNWTTYQATHTGKLIHEVRVERIDSQLYDTLKSFSLQLHHQKLEFTAGGFFPVNSTLLQAMVANITTYLVILIQFQPQVYDTM